MNITRNKPTLKVLVDHDDHSPLVEVDEPIFINIDQTEYLIDQKEYVESGQQQQGSQFQIVINSVNSLQNLIETQNYEVKKKIEHVEQRIEKHDEKAQSAHDILNEKLSSLESENIYFRNLVREYHNPDKLKKNSLYFAIGSLGSLGFSVFTGVDILHPILSILVLISSIVFHIMALIMKKQDETK